MRFCPECGLETEETARVCPNDGTVLVRLDPGHDPLVGQTLNGRYVLLRRLGRGGMGTVYEARQEPLGRPVALKLMRNDLARDARATERFLREAQVVSRLRNPHTITLYDFGQDQAGRLFLAMELMAGQRLDELLATAPPPLEEVLELVEQVCQSLGEAHAHGIIHRDLKPENVFVDRLGDQSLAKVLDFGIAKVRNTGKALTRTGKVFGTPAYMSPEQAQGFELDRRSDLYTVGVLLFELIVGQLPFDAETPMGVAMAHILEPPPSLQARSRYGRLPVRLEALVARLLAKAPADRPTSAEEVEHELAEVRRELAGEPGSGLHLARPIPAARHEVSGSFARLSQTLDPSRHERPVARAKRRRSRHRLALRVGFLALVLGAALWGGEELREGLERPGRPSVDVSRPSVDGSERQDLRATERQDVRAAEPPAVAEATERPGVDGSERPSVERPSVERPSVEPPAEVAAATSEEPGGTVLFEFVLQPDDAAVYIGDAYEPACEGSACAALALPRGDETLALRVARRHYVERWLAVVPDAPHRLAVTLERTSRGPALDEPEREATSAGDVGAEPVVEGTATEPAIGVVEDVVAVAPDAEPSESAGASSQSAEGTGSPLMRPVTLP